MTRSHFKGTKGYDPIKAREAEHPLEVSIAILVGFLLICFGLMYLAGALH